MRVRIISGRYGGRMIDTPSGFATHPMSERMRNAMFNMLGDVSSSSFLDAFAGSGAIAIEAASRGAKKVVAIEKDRKAQAVIEANLKALTINNVKLIRANASGWADTSDDVFDIIVCDPPYNDVRVSMLQKLTSKLADGGEFVVSLPSKMPTPTFDGLTLRREANYGNATIAIYDKNSG